jgi:hypothetical protein
LNRVLHFFAWASLYCNPPVFIFCIPGMTSYCAWQNPTGASVIILSQLSDPVMVSWRRHFFPLTVVLSSTILQRSFQSSCLSHQLNVFWPGQKLH